jgi:hypothetical protein
MQRKGDERNPKEGKRTLLYGAVRHGEYERKSERQCESRNLRALVEKSIEKKHHRSE